MKNGRNTSRCLESHVLNISLFFMSSDTYRIFRSYHIGNHVTAEHDTEEFKRSFNTREYKRGTLIGTHEHNWTVLVLQTM